MSIIAHTTSTVGSILGAISTAANSASRSITSASAGLDMLDNFIQAAKIKQETDIALELDNYEVRAVLTAGAEQQRFEESVLREMHSDPTRKAHFDRIHNRLTAVLEAKKAAKP